MAEKPLLVILDEMKNGQFLYEENIVTVLSSMVMDGGSKIEIYLDNGQTIRTRYDRLSKELDKFKPVGSSVSVVRHKAERNLVCSTDVIGELRDTLLAQIRDIRKNPTKEVIAQSKSVNETINQYTNLARVQMEYQKLMLQAKKMQ